MNKNVAETGVCFCGAKMPWKPVYGNWGDWCCPKCLAAYCQDCGECLDINDDCPHAKEQ